MADSDVALLRRWHEGDQRAASDLIRRHRPALRAFLRRRCKWDAEDVEQETFLACVQCASTFRGEASFRTFLLAIARRKLWTQRAERFKRQWSLIGVTCREVASLPSLRELSVGDALGTLSAELRAVIELSCLRDLETAEIAQALSIPIGTVASRIRRAKRALRRALASDPEVDDDTQIIVFTR